VIYGYAISAAAGAALALAVGWQYHKAEMLSVEIDRSKAFVRSLENHAAEAAKMQEIKDAALKESAKRQRSLSADVASGRSALERLRDAAEGAIRESQDSHSACIEKVDAFADVFGQCRVRLRDVAEAADDHAEDTRTLSDAWPK
jgi:hypothetical protein